MTARMPKVVAYARTGALDRILPLPWKLLIVSDWSPMYSDALIRLSDYEALQAERDALVEALEMARDRLESERRSGEFDPLIRDIDDALVAYRKGGEA